MKNWLIMILLGSSAAILLYLRLSSKIVANEMSAPGRAILWVSTFFLGFGPITIGLFKVLRHNWGYDASPFAILLYVIMVGLSAFIAWWIARWVVDVAD